MDSAGRRLSHELQQSSQFWTFDDSIRLHAALANEREAISMSHMSLFEALAWAVSHVAFAPLVKKFAVPYKPIIGFPGRLEYQQIYRID